MRSTRHEVVLHREHRGRGAGGNADLGVNVLDMVPCRLGRDDEAQRHVAVRPASCNHLQDFHLAVAQTCGPDGTRGRGAMTRRFEDGADSLAIQPALSDLRREVIRGRGRCESWPIWSLLRHSLVRIGGRQDTCVQGYRMARRLAVVPGAVLPFVVHASQRCQWGQYRRAEENSLALIGMQPDLFPLAGRQRTSLLPDAVGNAHTSKVVQQSRAAYRDYVWFVQPKSARRGLRQF